MAFFLLARVLYLALLIRHVFTLGYISPTLLKPEVRIPTLLISQKTIWFGTRKEEFPSSYSLNRVPNKKHTLEQVL
ncbi:hypothetical protein LINPERPRIM_LOCUS20050 [Linum perenne]